MVNGGGREGDLDGRDVGNGQVGDHQFLKAQINIQVHMQSTRTWRHAGGNRLVHKAAVRVLYVARKLEFNRRTCGMGIPLIGKTSTGYIIYEPYLGKSVVINDKVEAEVLDLAHGTAFTGASRITGGSDIGVVHGANVVVVTAGAKQEPGQSRLDLAGANVAILRDLMPALVEQAPDAIYMLVTNPCDVLTVAAHRFGGLPANRVFSSGTVLDSSRLKWLLAERVGVAPSSVHAMMVGEHGDSEFPLWSQARIGPIPIRDWAPAGRRAVAPRSRRPVARQRTTPPRPIAPRDALRPRPPGRPPGIRSPRGSRSGGPPRARPWAAPRTRRRADPGAQEDGGTESRPLPRR